MSLRLSHSQYNRFLSCGKSYEHYYINKIKPTRPKASLLFGTAIDRAISTLLEPKDESKTPEQTFDYFWRFQDVNGKQEYLPKLSSLLYSNKDFDKDLLLDEDYQKIQEEYSLDKDRALELLSKRIEVGHDKLSNKEKEPSNFIIWLSMMRKGHVMIKGFREKILPRIKRVITTQECITLENGDGDKIIGYIDLVAEKEGHEGPVILDIKTAASPYDDDAHLFAPQLILYLHASREKYSNTNKAGFIVLGKNIMKNKTKICSSCGHDGTGGRHKTCDNEIGGKRCNSVWLEKINPECFTQVMVGEVPEATEELVMSNIEDMTNAIKAGHFIRNLSNCKNMYGSPCEYIDLCYRGKMDNLKKEEKV